MAGKPWRNPAIRLASISACPLSDLRPLSECRSLFHTSQSGRLGRQRTALRARFLPGNTSRSFPSVLPSPTSERLRDGKSIPLSPVCATVDASAEEEASQTLRRPAEDLRSRSHLIAFALLSFLTPPPPETPRPRSTTTTTGGGVPRVYLFGELLESFPPSKKEPRRLKCSRLNGSSPSLFRFGSEQPSERCRV